MNARSITWKLVSPMVCALLAAVAQPQDGSPYNEVVAIAATDAGELAMTAIGKEDAWLAPEIIDLPKADSKHRQIFLSRSGTKILVAYDDDAFLGDLSTEIPLWNICNHTHQLPDAVFPIMGTDVTHVMTETELRVAASCPDTKGGVTSVPWPRSDEPTPLKLSVTAPICAPGVVSVATTTHWLVYATNTGALFVVDRERPCHPEAIKLTDSDRAERVYARADNSFLILVGGGGGYRGYSLTPPNRTLSHRPVFRLASTTATPRFFGALPQGPYDQVVPPLPDIAGGRFEFFTIVSNHELYAPALQFDETEMVLPTTVDIWTQDERALGDLDYLDWYRSLDPEPKCQLYYRTTSHPGTWLYEYWAYYPLDLGDLNSHPHDTEHTFVEVQKLRGIPRAVLSAGHGTYALNNIYSSFEAERGETVVSPELPLFTIVERGKHAMAPDINRDGLYTFGRDVNVVQERSQIWGIRDYIGRTDDHVSKWDQSMALPRQRQNIYTTKAFSSYFRHRASELELRTPISNTCELKRFPTEVPEESTAPGPAHKREAVRKLVEHADAEDPRSIYKRHVFPDWSFKTGVGWDMFNNFPIMSLS